MKTPHATLLVIDDDDAVRVFVERAFHSFNKHYDIHCLSCGDEAVAYLNGEGKFADRSKYKFPSFVITDLDMAPGDGFTVLDFLKHHPALSIIPVIMMSSSYEEDDVRTAYVLGASSFLIKPATFHQMKELLKKVHDYWSACEVPRVDEEGFALATDSRGRPGERFTKPKRHTKRHSA